MSEKPFSIRIFVADGDPDGLRIVERSNWIGKAVMFPRAIYTQVRDRDEFKQTGVYLLRGPSPDGDGETLYIGEADPVRPRLDNHHKDKDFWTKAVFFIAGLGQLNKAHVQHLESRLVAAALAAKRVKLDNGNKPAEPTLSEADRADMEVFLENILGMLPVLGIHAFEVSSPNTASVSGPQTLYCKGRGGDARGINSPQGFIVFSGSFVAPEVVGSFEKQWYRYFSLRNQLLESGVLVQNDQKVTFSQEYTFNSPSMASAIVLGCSPNGRIDWKDTNGRTLKEIQESEAKSIEEVE